jgi:SAM-dependent methyltransferase
MMIDPASPLTEARLAEIRAHYAHRGPPNRLAQGYRRQLAHYYNLLLPPACSLLEVGCGSGELLAGLRAARKVGVDLSSEQIALARVRAPDAEFHCQAAESLELDETFDVIILSDTANEAVDLQRVLERLHRVARPGTRLLLNIYNTLWRPVHRFAELVGLRVPHPESNWLSRQDMDTFLRLAGWQTIKHQTRLFCPCPIPWVADAINRWIGPLTPSLGFALFTIARPAPLSASESETLALSVSVVIPARNEAGNIEAAVRRTPEMGAWTELIFVEGHSQDDTWNEIERVRQAHPERRIRTLRQSGKGKGNAVREGFAAAAGDVLMILDADLTMPPEDLPKFYRAIASGRAEFANGCRLVYPMEKRAMQFLNMLANKLFGLAFSWLLDQPVKDTLCGTKVLRREHYQAIAANRAYFGDFDPFGDFDLLFGADKINLHISDIPIRYRERTYGSTNIQRWRHGWLLLRMMLFAARKLKFV